MADISEFNINNTLYNLKDAQARNDIQSISSDLNDYLPLTGGILTGSLTTSLQLTIKDNTIDTSTSPESNLWPKHLTIKDKDNVDRGYFEIYQGTSGIQGIQLETKRIINNENVYNGIRLGIDSEGNKTVTLNGVEAWQKALQVLSVNYGDSSLNSLVQNAACDISAASITSTAYSTFGVTDINNALVGFVEVSQRTNGSSFIKMTARRNNDDTIIDNTLQFGVSASGVRSVSVSDKPVWRNALGALNGVWPISSGGTSASTWSDAIENLGGMSGTALNLINDLDTATDYVMKARCSSSYNKTLNTAIAPSTNYVYVLQIYYSEAPGSKTATGTRMQIAFPYATTDKKFAWRTYVGGWGSWHPVTAAS